MGLDFQSGSQGTPSLSRGLKVNKNYKLRDLIGDGFAGTVIAISNIALAVSFAAAIFQGNLAAGFTTGAWMMLMTMIVVGLVIGMLTTLPPIAGGPDTAVIAAIGLMAPAVAGPLLTEGMPLEHALLHIMIGIAVVALVSGAVYLALGLSGVGQSLRFIPYPLEAGFLAATGIILISFSVEIVTGERFEVHQSLDLLQGDAGPKIGVMLVFALMLGGARLFLKSPLVTPVSFFGIALALNALLQTGQFGEAESWYLQTAKGLEAWMPLREVSAQPIDWAIFVTALPELATCVIVGLISLIVRISTFESGRMATADINHELRIYGGASILSGLSGGMTGGILFSTSKFLADSSARTRFVYLIIAAFLALTIFANLDLAGLVPTPILGGFLLLLGYAMTVEALKVTLRQRAVKDIALTLAIMTVCLTQGFIVGVVAGFVAACLLFAFNYARIGVVRRHITRQRLLPATERAPEIEAALRDHGDAIHIYELEGYIFFGSSEAVFEQIRQRRRLQSGMPIRCIILDLSRVTGYDSSAVNTLNKLRGYCGRHGIALVICGLGIGTFSHLFQGRIPADGPKVMHFREPIEALDWAEKDLLQSLDNGTVHDPEPGTLTAWLSREFGTPVSDQIAERYFERREAAAGERLYEQGAPADTIDFLVSGTVGIVLELGGGKQQCIRRSSRQTVIGEMGFFRGANRSATVVAETPAVIYALSRKNFERLQRDHLAIHHGLLNFVVRIVSDRLDMTTVELTAMRNMEVGERRHR